MTEKMITIPYGWGIKENLKLLCSFDYEGKHYFIARDPDDNKLVCRQMKWNIFRGTYQLTDTPSRNILEIANSLLRKSDENPNRYKMNGENYKISRVEKDGKRVLRYAAKGSCSKYFTLPMMFFSTAVNFIFALALAALYTFIYIDSTGMMWAATVFPNICRATLKIMLYAFELTGAAVLFKIRNENRGWWDLIMNVFIPLNLITIIGLAKANTVARIIIICLSVWFGLSKVLPLIRSLMSKDPKKVKKKKVHRALGKMYTPILVCVFCCIYVIRIFGIVGYTNIASTKTSYQESQTIMIHYGDALKSINANVWKNLTAQQRIDTLQSICDYECANTLGCKTATVQAGYPRSDNTLGEYNHITNTILINMEHMNEDPVHDVVITLLHETRHAYQHSVIKMLNDVEDKLDDDDKRLSVFQYAISIRDNLDNYKSASSNYEEYFDQATEADSRSWSENETYDRYDWYIYMDLI